MCIRDRCEDGDQQCQGTVLADTDSDSDTDDDDDDDDNDDDGEDRERALLARLIRRHHSPKHHGMVRVLWSDSEPGRVRLGRDGHVDIWCVSSEPGGQFYRDHLGVLDDKLVSAGDDDDNDDDGDDVWVDEAAGVTDIIRTRTPLGTSLESTANFSNDNTVQAPMSGFYITSCTV